MAFPSERLPQDPIETSGLVSVGDDIDAIAREALKEARRMEEAKKYRNNLGRSAPPSRRVHEDQ